MYADRPHLKSLLPQDDLIQRAFDFACDAHESINQRRLYTDQPYIVHPVAVALRLVALGATREQIAAALLHDVVEDVPDITIQMIYDEFGPIVGRMVAGLTDVSKLEDGDRATRKAMDAEHIRVQDLDVQMIKLADIEDNMVSIIAGNPGFARKKWIPEKRIQADICAAASPEVYALIDRQITDFMERR